MFHLLQNFIKLHNQGYLLFDRYEVDEVMLPSDSDSEDDALSSTGTTQNQGESNGNDNNFTNDMRDRIMFEIYLNYN